MRHNITHLDVTLKAILLVLSVALLISSVGCATQKPAQDPLAGWKGGQTVFEGCNLDKFITDDYRAYIQTLPSEARDSVDDVDIRCYENDTGEHAVRISIPIHGAWYEHVLIYDNGNRRIRTIVYSSGRYAS